MQISLFYRYYATLRYRCYFEKCAMAEREPKSKQYLKARKFPLSVCNKKTGVGGREWEKLGLGTMLRKKKNDGQDMKTAEPNKYPFACIPNLSCSSLPPMLSWTISASKNLWPGPFWSPHPLPFSRSSTPCPKLKAVWLSKPEQEKYNYRATFTQFAQKTLRTALAETKCSWCNISWFAVQNSRS